MAKKYWYFLISLPYIKFGEKSEYTLKDCFTAMEGVLSLDEIALCQEVVHAPFGDAISGKFSGKIAEWELFELSLRRELRALRERRRGSSETPVASDSDRSYSTLVKEAFEMESPLEMEITLDRLRWNKIEELLSGELYTKISLIGYLLQLKIIERHSCFRNEYGQRNFDKAFAVVDRYIRKHEERLEEGDSYE